MAVASLPKRANYGLTPDRPDQPHRRRRSPGFARWSSGGPAARIAGENCSCSAALPVKKLFHKGGQIGPNLTHYQGKTFLDTLLPGFPRSKPRNPRGLRAHAGAHP
ncbi:MAG: hypothetical protein CM1200mP29_04440 [Verrucomicrobiota bacterium]|nr:MAG: hypothetical protein CM1200mP29_04440 [Verrucomicrobiota bacterium]